MKQHTSRGNPISTRRAFVRAACALSVCLVSGFHSAQAQINSDTSFHHRVREIRAIVVERQGAGSQKDWVLYHDIHLKKVAGRATAGDSVTVTAWAPWLFYVSASKLRGYISWKSLRGGARLDSLRIVIERRSSDEEEKLGFPLDSLPKPKAYLSFKAVKTRLSLGECTPVTLALHVSDSNRARMQFYDVERQLSETILKHQQTISGAWVLPSRIIDIEGDERPVKGYTTFRLNEPVYCSVMGTKTLELPALKISLLRLSGRMVRDTVYFTSKRFVIRVDQDRKPSVTDSSNLYVRFGQFQFSDKFTNPRPQLNELVEYTITIQGTGLLFPYQAPEIKLSGVNVHDMMVEDSDTLISNILRSKKVVRYRISFSKHGKYSFKDLIKFNYFDPLTKKEKFLASKASVSVEGFGTDDIPPVMKPTRHKVVIDVSMSMAIEDCEPTRLEMVKRGLDKFLEKRNRCDFGIILFASSALKYSAPAAGQCYSTDKIQIWLDDDRGTAIGDAVFMAANESLSAGGDRRLVLISDGDNTGGHVTPALAAEIAKKHGLTIYCIGVGKYGPVKYGNDLYGNPNMFSDTFDDRSLKLLATKTKGKYYPADSAEVLAKILNEILTEN